MGPFPACSVCFWDICCGMTLALFQWEAGGNTAGDAHWGPCDPWCCSVTCQGCRFFLRMLETSRQMECTASQQARHTFRVSLNCLLGVLDGYLDLTWCKKTLVVSTKQIQSTYQVLAREPDAENRNRNWAYWLSHRSSQFGFGKMRNTYLTKRGDWQWQVWQWRGTQDRMGSWLRKEFPASSTDMVMFPK